MYLTTYKQNKTTSITPIDYIHLLENPITVEFSEFYKITYFIANPKPRDQLKNTEKANITQAEQAIELCYNLLKSYINPEDYYLEFSIPKRTGGLRQISAPTEEFKAVLKTVKDIFKTKIKCLPHSAAYAYVDQTSRLDAIEKHQKNKSKWFLKIDLSNFFPNCTTNLVYTQLLKLYPFYYFSDKHKEILRKVIEKCSLHGSLPQGSPISPLLTNLLMVPYDAELKEYLKEKTLDHYVYTRFADDILISSKADFDYKELIKTLNKILKPFQIKEEKTRYGSSAGSNWNLGLMLNKDNKITLGSTKKKTLNAMLNNFLKDFKNDVKWPKEDVYILQGKLGELQNIEPEYYNYIIHKYQKKYNLNFKQAVSVSLKLK